MSYAYVYVPKSGVVWATNIYCNKPGQPAHSIVGGSGFGSPVDIGSGSWVAGDDILFRATTNIFSFKAIRIVNVCSGPTPPSPWTNGLKLELYTGYNATGTMIGVVLYGHLQNHLGNGVIKNKPASGSWAEYIGEVPGNCACPCSDGIHVHMECKSGSRNSLSCNQSVTTSTWLYNWIMPV